MECVNIRGSAKPWAVEGAKTVIFNLGTTQMEAYDVLSDMATSTIHEPGVDRPLAEVSSSGTLTFYHQDWLGNVAMLTSAAGCRGYESKHQGEGAA